MSEFLLCKEVSCRGNKILLALHCASALQETAFVATPLLTASSTCLEQMPSLIVWRSSWVEEAQGLPISTRNVVTMTTAWAAGGELMGEGLGDALGGDLPAGVNFQIIFRELELA